MIASSRPSVSSCRTRRRREAPSESRTATSRWRTEARASSRFATLPQAISSTSPTTVSSSPAALTMFWRKPGLIVACASGRSATLRPALSFAYSLASCVARFLSLASACASVTPGLSRPATLKISARRESMFSFRNPVATCGCAMSGSHRAGCAIVFTPLKPFGAMPTTVNA